MKKLEIEIYRLENLLFGKVLHMDESLREKGVLASVDGDICFEIESSARPQLVNNILYVWGSNTSRDGELFSYLYDDIDEAKIAAKSIVNIVDKINDSESSSAKSCLGKIEKVI